MEQMQSRNTRKIDIGGTMVGGDAADRRAIDVCDAHL